MANDKKILPTDSPERGIDGHPPDNIPVGAPGHTQPAAGTQALNSSATPTNPEKAKPDVNPDAPRGKQRYRVKGPGSVKINGVLFAEGAELELAAAEAQTIDGFIELVPSDKIEK